MEYARLRPTTRRTMPKHSPRWTTPPKINPKLAEPHFLMAQRQTEPPKRIQELKLAAKLDARNLAYWQALAEAYLDAHDFPQAAQAWKSAEQAAATPGDRARMQRNAAGGRGAAAWIGKTPRRSARPMKKRAKSTS